MIELTQAHTGKPVYANPSLVSSMTVITDEKDGRTQRTLLFIPGGGSLCVQETPDEILVLIEEERLRKTG